MHSKSKRQHSEAKPSIAKHNKTQQSTAQHRIATHSKARQSKSQQHISKHSIAEDSMADLNIATESSAQPSIGKQSIVKQIISKHSMKGIRWSAHVRSPQLDFQLWFGFLPLPGSWMPQVIYEKHNEFFQNFPKIFGLNTAQTRVLAVFRAS